MFLSRYDLSLNNNNLPTSSSSRMSKKNSYTSSLRSFKQKLRRNEVENPVNPTPGRSREIMPRQGLQDDMYQEELLEGSSPPNETAGRTRNNGHFVGGRSTTESPPALLPRRSLRSPHGRSSTASSRDSHGRQVTVLWRMIRTILPVTVICVTISDRKKISGIVLHKFVIHCNIVTL